MEKDGSVLITTSFLMSADNEGSYICQMIPINLTTDGDWILTRWMHLKIRKMSIRKSCFGLHGLFASLEKSGKKSFRETVCSFFPRQFVLDDAGNCLDFIKFILTEFRM